MAEKETFRSPFAILVWWVWVLFAAGNLIDLAVQGRDHLSVVAAFILVLVTGVIYVTAQRPRIIADDDGLTIENPLRDHRVGWPAVAGVDTTELLRVRCEWPLDGAPGSDGPADGSVSTGQRSIYSWAVHASRRRQVTAQLRAERRPGLRTRSPAGYGGFGTPAPAPAPASSPPSVMVSERIVAAITARADQAHAASPRPQARPPVSTWHWPAFAAILIPALALIIAILSLSGRGRRAAGPRPASGPASPGMRQRSAFW